MLLKQSEVYSQESTSSEWDVVNEIFLFCFEFSYEERGFPTIPLIGMKPAFQTGLAVADRTSDRTFSTGCLIHRLTKESGTHWAHLNPFFGEQFRGLGTLMFRITILTVD